jgi:hypothetical protein
MNSKSLARHRQELHDAFFEDRDQELLDFLEFETKTNEDEERAQLEAKAGISAPEVLQELRQAGITSALMNAFMLLPLVRLAWADSSIQEGEFESLLKAASDEGITYGTPSYRLLSRWLEERPSAKVIEAWQTYARALARELDEASLLAFQQATLGRARRLAEVSGGILGLGERISENERLVLNDLANALTKPKP